MKIECRLKREGGSDIDIDGVTYPFRPDEEGRHVCEVDNEVHAQRFLSIVEAYKIPGAPDPKPVVAPVVAQQAEGPSMALDDDAVKTFLIEELGIEDPGDQEELREYCAEVLDVDVPDLSGIGAKDIAMHIGRFIIDNQTDPETNDDDKGELSDVEVLAYVVDVFGIEEPTDKDALKAYAAETFGAKVSKKLTPVNMARAMIEAHTAQEGAED